MSVYFNTPTYTLLHKCNVSTKIYMHIKLKDIESLLFDECLSKKNKKNKCCEALD